MDCDEYMELLSLANSFEFKRELAEVEENLKKVEAMERNSEFYIHSYFQEIINKVDIRRETFKATIDECSDALLESIRNTESKFIKLSKEVNVVNTKLEKSKTELNGYVEKHSESEFFKDNLDIIRKDAVNLNRTFKDIDNTTYEFIEGPVIESLKIENMFGKLVWTIGKLKSNILDTSKLQHDLIAVCGFNSNDKWRLEYRASKDGFCSASFHAKCDGLANTLTVVKTTEGNIFGGFARKPWSSINKRLKDQESFSYKLVDKLQKQPEKYDKYDCGRNVCSVCRCHERYLSRIYCHGSYGPSFYGPCDILISSNSNRNQESSIKVVSGYLKHFQTVEVEVFTKMTKVNDENLLFS